MSDPRNRPDQKNRRQSEQLDRYPNLGQKEAERERAEFEDEKDAESETEEEGKLTRLQRRRPGSL